MKHYSIFLLLFFSFHLSAQNSNPFLLFDSYVAFDRCVGIIEKSNGDLVTLHQFSNFLDNPDGTIIGDVDRSTLPFMSHTLIWKYNSNGNIESFIPIQSTDSLYYHGFYLLELSNGKFLVAGDVMQTWNLKTDIFFAILNENADSVENIVRIERPQHSEFALGVWEKNNANLILYYTQQSLSPQRESLIEVDIQGNIINELYNFNLGVYTNSTMYNSFYLNDTFYHQFSGNNGLLAIDENFNVSLGTNQQIALLSEGGVEFNNTILINGISAKVYQVYSKDSASLLYQDPTSTGGGGRFSTIDYVDADFIYFTHSTQIDSGSISIYCINSLGDLNWKKSIELTDLDLYSHMEGVHQFGKATKDKGYVLAFGVDDGHGFGDSYILKLDSNGNEMDIFTSINQNTAFNSQSTPILLYPNPTNGSISFNSLNNFEDYSIVIYSFDGKILVNKTINSSDIINVLEYKSKLLLYNILNEIGEVIEVGKLLVK